MFVQHCLIEVRILEETSNGQEQGSHVHLHQSHELVLQLVRVGQVLLEELRKGWFQDMSGQFSAQIYEVRDLVFLVLNWDEGGPDCVCGADEPDSHAAWEVTHQELQKLLQFFLVLEIFKKLGLLSGTELRVLPPHELLHVPLEPFRFTSKKGALRLLHLLLAVPIFQGFYVILIIFAESSLMLLHKILLEADLIPRRYFLLRKGLKPGAEGLTDRIGGVVGQFLEIVERLSLVEVID